MVEHGSDQAEHYFLPTASRWRATHEEVWTPPAEVEHHHDNEDCGCEWTIAYLRVSKVGDRDPDSLKSPDIQLDAIKEDCKRHNKRIVLVLSDIDKSGRTFRKRSVDKAIALIKNGDAKSVTLWKLSRWGRNVEQSMLYMTKVKAVGGRVDSATEPFDPNTPFGKYNQTQLMAMDEYHSDMIGAGWQSAHTQRRTHGLPHSGRPRFGYRYLTRERLRDASIQELPHGSWTLPTGIEIPDSSVCELCRTKQAHFWPDETTAPVLVEMYGKYMSGTSTRRLAAMLNERGFRTAFGGRWTQQATGQMMDTGFAAGLIRERSPAVLKQIKAKEELAGKKLVRNSLKTFDVWRPGAQPALISMTLWERYKARRLELSDVPPRSRVPVHALSRLLFCEICSRRLTTKYAGTKRQHQWQCPSKDTYHPGIPVSVSNAAVLEIIHDWVVENIDPSTESRSVDEIARAAYGATSSTVRSPSRIQIDIDNKERAHLNLVMMKAEGQINDAQFERAKAAFDAQIAELRTELEQAVNVQGVTGKPSYTAFESLDAVWEETLTTSPIGLNAPLRELIAFVIVSPALGRSRWDDSRDRVEIVASWDREIKDSWLDSRRRRFEA
jgi:site-specific DNA recombinase